jgi:hypothetical protein
MACHNQQSSELYSTAWLNTTDLVYITINILGVVSPYDAVYI